MIVGGLVAAAIGVSAEGRSLEDVATPLSARRPGTRAKGSARSARPVHDGGPHLDEVGAAVVERDGAAQAERSSRVR
jgi:hypothetical protein